MNRVAPPSTKPSPGDEWGEEQQARAGFYLLLGNLLGTPPDQDALQSLRETLRSWPKDEGGLFVALSGLEAAANRARPEQLEEEYFSLFIGLGRGELSPYASWYLTGFLLEKPLANLRQDLAKLGFERQSAVSEPEDHAAAICEVMGMIVSESVLSFEQQQAFFESYLKPWLNQFFRDLTQAETADFYKSVGNLGQCFMEIETRYFAMPV